MIEGSAIIEGQQLNRRDGLGISESESVLSIKATTDAEILIMDIPMV